MLPRSQHLHSPSSLFLQFPVALSYPSMEPITRTLNGTQTSSDDSKISRTSSYPAPIGRSKRRPKWGYLSIPKTALAMGARFNILRFLGDCDETVSATLFSH